MLRNLDYWQGARYQFGQKKGHYESWFLRANHPSRNEAFWIRYTIFSPHGRPQDAIGELWVIHSDGENKRVRAAKEELPVTDCHFSPRGLNVKIGEATLRPGELQGEARRPHRIRWNLRYEGGGAPMVFLPENLYETPLPKAKAVTQRPLVRFSGTLEVDGETVEIRDWTGSENHNWGSKHTDTYAWGQVAGFDDAPDAFLEAATAKLKFGPLWTPPLTILCLRLEGEDYKLNALTQSLRATGSWEYFDWRFDSRDRKSGLRIHGRIHATRADFVGLTYYNPPGGAHTCLNSKIAACELTLERPGRPPRTLHTAHRAAFEILTDDTGHGVPLAT
ncbi:MAG: hypothetical protein ACOY33_07440 [Pseudomonadota bacterium]